MATIPRNLTRLRQNRKPRHIVANADRGFRQPARARTGWHHWLMRLTSLRSRCSKKKPGFKPGLEAD
jgi:hypothetical protein